MSFIMSRKREMNFPNWIRAEYICIASFIILAHSAYAYYEQTNWAFHFPYGSNMGLYMALALPIDVPNENVFVAYNFEANYLLPNNYSEIVQIPPFAEADEERGGSDGKRERLQSQARRLDRATFYTAVEQKMDAYGYKGRDCVLRTICESASSHFDPRRSGLLGDILHIILTPSSSNEKNKGKLLPVYFEAEKQGRDHADCTKFIAKEKCPTSFLNFITAFV